MVRTNQGGSILSFIVVAVALVALLIGGVWAVRHYDLSALQERDATEVAHDTNEAPVDEPQTDTSEDTPEKEAPSSSSEDDKRTNSTDEPASSNDDTATDTQPRNDTSRDTPQSDSAPSTVPETAVLPQTGPAEWVNGIAAGALVGAVAAYAASRRQLASL